MLIGWDLNKPKYDDTSKISIIIILKCLKFASLKLHLWWNRTTATFMNFSWNKSKKLSELAVQRHFGVLIQKNSSTGLLKILNDIIWGNY